MKQEGHYLAVSTSNGVLFVIDIKTREFICKNKIHTGSIEGLTWKDDMLATVSGDCAVHLSHVE